MKNITNPVVSIVHGPDGLIVIGGWAQWQGLMDHQNQRHQSHERCHCCCPGQWSCERHTCCGWLKLCVWFCLSKLQPLRVPTSMGEGHKWSSKCLQALWLAQAHQMSAALLRCCHKGKGCPRQYHMSTWSPKFPSECHQVVQDVQDQWCLKETWQGGGGVWLCKMAGVAGHTSFLCGPTSRGGSHWPHFQNTKKGLKCSHVTLRGMVKEQNRCSSWHQQESTSKKILNNSWQHI